MVPEIKICGLTCMEEAIWLREEKVNYAGLVLFYEKSKRNNRVEQVFQILRALKEPGFGAPIKSVAVVVSPTAEQVQIIEKLGFDLIQVHGEVKPEVVKLIHIPMIRAVQVKDDNADAEMSQEIGMEKASAKAMAEKSWAYLYDAAEPGSGKSFDWEKLGKIPANDRKRILAGGLHAGNVRRAIETVRPDIVDVSSGVELGMDVVGKDREKIKEFVRKVRTNE